LVINSVARLFWAERKIEKARLWLKRAVDADKDNGDLWAWWLKFERQHGEQVSCRVSSLFRRRLLTTPHDMSGTARGCRQAVRCAGTKTRHSLAINIQRREERREERRRDSRSGHCRYQMIEREAYAVVWHAVVLQSDHSSQAFRLDYALCREKQAFC
jgi:hypothetical protein